MNVTSVPDVGRHEVMLTLESGEKVKWVYYDRQFAEMNSKGNLENSAGVPEKQKKRKN